ncbi:trihelix transcription factor ENAP1 [Vicia villosa]|uniref:trihelix transcription factor ENAP1 n=1 Tax=Vicia villosa TaxID=3911 RepID=UPI00273BE2D6|nr:trihelix transcription factor ENAP1 [Vicia villosa]
MDDMEDDARYPSKGYPLRRKNPNLRQKHPIRNLQYHRYDDPEGNNIDDEYDDDEHEEFDDYSIDENGIENGYVGNFEGNEGFIRKKRKLRSGGGGGGSSVSNYELVPRGKFGYINRGGGGGGSSGSEEWTEHATFVLLEIWGEKFLQIGRNSLRSEEWHEVSEKVSEELKVEKDVAECRSVLDKVKRRYKKEKSRMDEMGLGVNSCKWPFFKRMDMLMSSSARQEYGLACGVDSGEYVFMNTRVYLNRSNGFDEMRDSPGESEASEDDYEGDDFDGDDDDEEEDEMDKEEEEASYRVLADSIQKFGKIYEKIENTKRQQMMELEKMRVDFNRELELQKKQILERAQDEISKIQVGDDGDDDDDDDEDTDTSADNLSE